MVFVFREKGTVRIRFLNYKCKGEYSDYGVLPLYVYQGKRIKIQAHYECRRHDTSSKPRVE